MLGSCAQKRANRGSFMCSKHFHVFEAFLCSPKRSSTKRRALLSGNNPALLQSPLSVGGILIAPSRPLIGPTCRPNFCFGAEKPTQQLQVYLLLRLQPTTRAKHQFQFRDERSQPPLSKRRLLSSELHSTVAILSLVLRFARLALT